MRKIHCWEAEEKVDDVGTGLFQTSRGIPQQKAKRCGFATVGFWLSHGPQSQLPAEPGTVAQGGQHDHHSQHLGQDRASPRCFGRHAPQEVLSQGIRAHKAAATAVLDGRAAEKSLTLFFLPSLLLKSLLLHKALSHT